jgi:uncharacterized membrane protein YfcA
MSQLLVLAAFAVVALLYASVGHGGASGYLVLGALMGMGQTEMRLPALLMNMVVSGIAFIRFQRSGHFRWSVFWPFALTSIPMAWLGSTMVLDPYAFECLLGLALLLAAARLLGFFGPGAADTRPVVLPIALMMGAMVGSVSGLIGIGGGIFLSPLLILLRWSSAHTAAAVSALFIFVNSVAGAVGAGMRGETVPGEAWQWMAAAAVGGLAGAWMGASRLGPAWMERVLGCVLLFACLKLIMP